MSKKTISKICASCRGTGTVYFSLFTSPGEDGQGGFDGVSSKPCPICDATGYVEFGLLDKDLVKDIKEIKDVVDLIWAKVNV